MVVATLQEVDPETGKPLDLRAIGHKLEEIRAKYETTDYTVTSSASPSRSPTSPMAPRVCWSSSPWRS